MVKVLWNLGALIMLTVLIVRVIIGDAPNGGWYDWFMILWALIVLWLHWASDTIDAEIKRQEKKRYSRRTPWVHMDTP